MGRIAGTSGHDVTVRHEKWHFEGNHVPRHRHNTLFVFRIQQIITREAGELRTAYKFLNEVRQRVERAFKRHDTFLLFTVRPDKRSAENSHDERPGRQAFMQLLAQLVHQVIAELLRAGV
ncbi:TPA: hypothetical protein JD836_14560 [Citrobacter freundii]|nr:hypothetical protein [Citrobacter freundii]HCD1268020.1 hypothetical protein [Citrobacter freundii]